MYQYVWFNIGGEERIEIDPKDRQRKANFLLEKATQLLGKKNECFFLFVFR